VGDHSHKPNRMNVSEIIKVSSTKYSPLLWVGGDLKFEVKKQSRRDNHKDQVERKRENLTGSRLCSVESRLTVLVKRGHFGGLNNSPATAIKSFLIVCLLSLKKQFLVFVPKSFSSACFGD
jgi:hypothetical protein